MMGCVKCFHSNKPMSFKVNDNRLLKKYTKMTETVTSLMDIVISQCLLKLMIIDC